MTNMRHTLRIIVAKKRAAVLKDAVSGAPATELKASLEELATYSQLEDIADSAWTRDSLFAVVVALIIVIVAGLLWGLKIGTSNISLAANTANVEIRLLRPWDMSKEISGSEVHVTELSSANDPNLGLTLLDQSDGSVWINLQGGTIQLESFHVDQDAELSLGAGDGILQMAATGKPIQGSIQISGKGILTAGVSGTQLVSKPFDLAIPETIEFSSRKSIRPRTQLVIHSPEKWTFGPLVCRNLGFSYELRSLAERQVVSDISSGTLKFTDVSWPAIALAQNEELDLKGADRTRTTLSAQNGQVHVVVNGGVDEVILGGTESNRRIAPSYLEYLYNKKSLLLFWAAVTAGWGLLWGIRKTIFR